MIKNLGFNFDNTYADLPEIMATKLSPIAVKKPKLVILNKILAKSLGLDLSKISDEILSYWNARDIFKKSIDKLKNQDSFIFFEGKSL